MKKILMLFTIFYSLLTSLYGQQRIRGVVLDFDTKQPLSNATVYINNTQIVTKTNDKGEFNLYSSTTFKEFVVSSVGYKKIISPITSGNVRYNILLNPINTALNEVTIGYDKNGWKKWGKFFIHLFIGKGLHYKLDYDIKNPEVLNFRYNEKSGILNVSTKQALIVENYMLGYKLHIDLDDFEYNFSTDQLLYNSSVYFEEGKFPKSVPLNLQMKANLDYYGSKMHFYRSLYSNRLAEEGFSLYRYSEVKNIERDRVVKKIMLWQGNKKAHGASALELSKLSDNKDSAKYYKKVLAQKEIISCDSSLVLAKDFIQFDSVQNVANFNFTDTLMVIYRWSKETKYKLINLDSEQKTKPSYTLTPNFIIYKTLINFINDDGLKIYNSGTVSDNNLLMIGGKMPNQGLAHLLPSDYDPEIGRIKLE